MSIQLLHSTVFLKEILKDGFLIPASAQPTQYQGYGHGLYDGADNIDEMIHGETHTGYPYFVFLSPFPVEIFPPKWTHRYMIGFPPDILVGKNAFINKSWYAGIDEDTVRLSTTTVADVNISLQREMEHILGRVRDANGNIPKTFIQRVKNTEHELGEVLVRENIPISAASYLWLRQLPSASLLAEIREKMPNAIIHIAAFEHPSHDDIGCMIRPIRPTRMYMRPTAPLRRDARVNPIICAARRVKLYTHQIPELMWAIFSHEDAIQRIVAALEPVSAPSRASAKISARDKAVSVIRLLLHDFKYDGYASERFLPADTDIADVALEIAGQMNGDITAAGHELLYTQISARVADFVAGDISVREFAYNGK